MMREEQWRLRKFWRNIIYGNNKRFIYQTFIIIIDYVVIK